MKIYVNIAFLENLFLAEEETEWHSHVKKLLSSQQSAIEIIVDVDVEETYKSSNPVKRDMKVLLRQISPNITGSDFTFPNACQEAVFHESGGPKLLFIDNLPLDTTRRFGCFCVSTTCLEEADFLFYPEELRIDRSQTDWSKLSKIKHPCNALVLTDNYLFTDKNVRESTYLENIQSISKSLMPDSLTEGFQFDFTIIGFDSKNLRTIQEEYKKLTDYFQQQFPYYVNLTIIRDTYHDRYLFTNYYRIASGQGFALFKNRGLIPGKETTIHGKAITHEGRLSSADQTRRQELQKCIFINRTDRMPDKLAGNRKNRLLR